MPKPRVVLPRRGYQVILVARNEARLAAIAADLSDEAIWIACDASSGTAVQAMAQRVEHEIGTPDVLVHCAGLGEWKRIEDTPPEDALTMIGAPYLAAFNITQAFMQPMLDRKAGVIIHVNSPACYMPWPSSVGYTASRFALRGLHEALCQDLAGSGVRSCHVVFGRIDSAYFEHNQGVVDRMPRISSTIRTITTEECARVLLRVAERPRRQVVYPTMLGMYYGFNKVAPGVVRWLLRATAPKRTTGAGLQMK